MRAEWGLHLYAVASMIPYFFAAGHVNYARQYELYYMILPEEIEIRFRNVEPLMRHKTCVWNAIWSDMFIETTFMRFGHGLGGGGW